MVEKEINEVKEAKCSLFMSVSSLRGCKVMVRVMSEKERAKDIQTMRIHHIPNLQRLLKLAKNKVGDRF